MNQRLRELLEILDITQRELAESLGVSANAVTEVLKGRTKAVPSRWLLILMEKYNMNANWLLTGVGEPIMFQSVIRNQNTELLKNVSLLPPHKRTVVEDFIGYLQQRGWGKIPAEEFTLEKQFPAQIQASDFVAIPLLGSIAAGKPIFAEENREEELFLPYSLVGMKTSLFALRVKGDSMQGAGILANDIAILHSSASISDLSNGIIVAMLLQEEATIKYFYKEKEKYILRPANPHYKDIVLRADDQPRLLGKLRMVLRSYA